MRSTARRQNVSENICMEIPNSVKNTLKASLYEFLTHEFQRNISKATMRLAFV
jgi:hypothetical protein